MKVLFVSGGNSSSGISTLVRAQGDSLTNLGLSIDYFPIVGKGLKGYLANVKPLREKIRSEKYDLVHAHFSFCGFVAALAGAQPLVVSLMGWNVRKPLLKLTIKFINRIFWRACIVKSAEMQNFLRIRDLILLPKAWISNYLSPLINGKPDPIWDGKMELRTSSLRPIPPDRSRIIPWPGKPLLCFPRASELNCMSCEVSIIQKCLIIITPQMLYF